MSGWNSTMWLTEASHDWLKAQMYFSITPPGIYIVEKSISSETNDVVGLASSNPKNHVRNCLVGCDL